MFLTSPRSISCLSHLFPTLLLFLVFQQACAFLSVSQSETPRHETNRVSVPVGGNSWLQGTGKIGTGGLQNWTDTQATLSTYIRFEQPGKAVLSLVMSAADGPAIIRVTLFGKSQEVRTSGKTDEELIAGSWDIASVGYAKVTIQGISKTGATFGVLKELGVSGSAVSPTMSFVRDNADNYFYWGRRGPSVHLRFTSPAAQTEWFYSEINVPAGNDVIGSYYMANGFSNGYFGIQVNSPTERRVLFSIWSPFQTDDPSKIPTDQRIELLKKGEEVVTNDFGNEGSGGQSFLRYNWQAGTTYGFLVQGKPDGNGNTVYTAYFFAPETGKWRLIASFKRPKTNVWLSGLYSFLENFTPETGTQERSAFYQNQWVCNSEGNWFELTETRFTADNTARKNFRKDYGGGLRNGQFFLRNCGFFSDFTPFDTLFKRPSANRKPVIDFSKLPY